jgi:hypothetical protein
MRANGIEDLYKLSPIQEGILFHSLYAEGNDVYLRHLTCLIEGKLNVPVLKKAWQRVVDHYPVFRTSILWEEMDKPVQVVSRHVELPFEEQDWSGVSSQEQNERLEDFLRTERKRTMDFGKAPLMRLEIIRLSEDLHQFVWGYHHVIIDGWSKYIVIKQIFSSYDAIARGHDFVMKPSRPYCDYIAWLRTQDLSRAEAFWRQNLKGIASSTGLGSQPKNEPQDGGRSYGEKQVELSEPDTAALLTQARRHRLTLNTILQGAWAMLLSHESGEQDVIFGATVSGRPADLQGVESMIGIFINTLPVTARMSPGQTLLDKLKELQQQQAEMRQYEYSPLVQVQAWSDIPRGQQMFDSILVFNNYPTDAALRERGGDIQIKNVRVIEGNHYPLVLAIAPGARLTIRVPYDIRRFNAAAIDRLLAHFKLLLTVITEQPEIKIGSLKDALLEADKQYRLARQKQFRTATGKSLNSIQPKPVSGSRLMADPEYKQER